MSGAYPDFFLAVLEAGESHEDVFEGAHEEVHRVLQALEGLVRVELVVVLEQVVVNGARVHPARQHHLQDARDLVAVLNSAHLCRCEPAVEDQRELGGRVARH